MDEIAFDVFISYRHADAGRVEPLVAALRSLGLRVWFDALSIEDFASITGRIAAGLARAKAVVVWYSARYPESRACQWELSTAFVAAQRDGDPRQRVLVVNPEPDNRHIDPVELRDGLYLVPASADPLGAAPDLARRIAAQLGRVDGALGDLTPLRPPQWHPQPRFGSERFVGRLREMWQLHSALWAASLPIITNRAGPALVQLVGLGGSGKSLLAEEYALRFGAAYPGGVVWLDALGPEPQAPAALATARERQLRALAEQLLARTLSDCSPAEVEGLLRQHVERQGRPLLWVVDDVPPGMAAAALRAWAAPHPLGHTVFTTRSREYANLASAVEVESLDPAAAFDLLTRRRSADDAAARNEATAIAAELGHHALALEVASARLAFCSFAEFLDELRQPSADALQLAAQFADELPNGHEKSVVGTLLRSIRQLDDGARALLQLAAVFGRAVIPYSAIEAGWVEHARAAGLPAERSAAQLALRSVLRHSLVEPAGPEAIRLHALVRRVMAFETDAPARAACQRAAIHAVGLTCPAWATRRDHPTVQPWIDHARALQAARVDPLAEAGLLGLTGRFDAERGDRLAALHALREANETWRALAGSGDARRLQAALSLAQVEAEQSGGDAAIATLSLALQEAGDALPDDDPAMLDALNALGCFLSDAGRLSEARVMLEQVVEARLRSLGPDHPLAADALDNLANTLARQGDLPAARARAEQALAVSRRARGDQHADTLTIMNNLAITLRELHELPAACDLQRQVLQGRRQLFGDESWETVRALENLATTLEAQGDSAQAATLRDEAWALQRPLRDLAYPVG